jgi:hypothetical protein
MRTQATIVPTFWTRGSGKKLRGHPNAQVLALYFMTSPQSTMVGLYYEPLTTILHDTGLTEAQFREALPLVSEIALYDEQEGLVYLPEGAAHQVGATMSIKDNKRKSILAQLEVYGGHPFVRRWMERYYVPYNFSHEGIPEPLRSPYEPPSEGLSQAPDPRSDPYPRSAPKPKPESAPSELPLVAPLQVRAQTWMRDPTKASLAYPNPHRWTEMLELRDLVASTFGIETDELRPPNAKGELDERVRLVLERWAEGTDQARMRKTVTGAKRDDLIGNKVQLQALQTIFKNAAAVDKYSKLAREQSAPVDKSNRVKLSPEAQELKRRRQAGEL